MMKASAGCGVVKAAQEPVGHHLVDQAVEVRLDDVDLAAVDLLDHGGVHIDADDR